MTNQEILTKAIEKAVANGFDCRELRDAVSFKLKTPTNPELAWKPEWILVRWFNNDGREVEHHLFAYIFSHDFAKALWGEGANQFVEYDGDDLSHFIPTWQYHLQQMVIAPDPIKYLGEHLDD